MTRKTVLNFFCDTASGLYGVTHDNAIHNNTPFNAVWCPLSLFHDLLEHYFEDKHPYFSRGYAFNIGGEVAAMGHFFYYTWVLNFSKRAYANSMLGAEYLAGRNTIIRNTTWAMEESICRGESNYGYDLSCAVPYQRPVPGLDDLIRDHWKYIKDLKVQASEESAREYAIDYKKSIKLFKLQRLYRWGYYQAAKLVPNNAHNLAALHDLYDALLEITKLDAEELINDYEGIEFQIKGGKRFKWDAHFISHEQGNIHYLDVLAKETTTTSSL